MSIATIRSVPRLSRPAEEAIEYASNASCAAPNPSVYKQAHQGLRTFTAPSPHTIGLTLILTVFIECLYITSQTFDW